MEEGEEPNSPASDIVYCIDDSETNLPGPCKSRTSVDEQITKLSDVILLQKEYLLHLSSIDETNFKDRVDIYITQLREITQYLNLKCDMIDKMNILMCILTFKIYDLQHNFNVRLDKLLEQRDTIMLSKDDEQMVPLELLETDKIIRELQYCHHEKSKGYKKHKVDIQLEYEKTCADLDEKLQLMRDILKCLSGEHEKFLGDVRMKEPLLIDYIIQAAMEEFIIVIEQFEVKQKRGWKSLYGDEELIDILQAKGLAVTKSGYILTETGEKMSYDEAEKKNLLEGLDFRSRLFPKDKENDDIIPTASSIPSTESEKESMGSQISSEDVSYLKEILGKPLTLALAEITTRQPRDPIHYLGHWLFKYRYNQELDETQKQEYEALIAERNRLLRERLHKLYEEEARLVLFEMINNAENITIRKELERILREQMMAGEEENDQAANELAELYKLLKIIEGS